MRAAGRRDGEALAPAGMCPGGPLPGERGCRSGSRRSSRPQDCILRTASDAPATGDQGIDARVQQRPYPGSVVLPYLDPPPCPHVPVVQSSNPLCDHEINKAKRGPGGCGRGEDRGLSAQGRDRAPVSCRSNYVPATRSHTASTRQPHTNCTPATLQLHTSHMSGTHQPHINYTPATHTPHTSHSPSAHQPHSAHTGREITCSKPSPSAWPLRVERVL